MLSAQGQWLFAVCMSTASAVCAKRASAVCVRTAFSLCTWKVYAVSGWTASILAHVVFTGTVLAVCSFFVKKRTTTFYFSWNLSFFFFFFRRGVVGHKGSCSTGQMIVWVDVCQVHVGNMKVLKSEEFGGCFQLWCVQGFCVPLCAVKDLFMSLKMLLNKNDSRLSCWSIMREPEGFYDFRVIG